MFVYFPKTAYRLFLAGLLVASVLGLASLLPAAAQEPDKGIGEATLQLWPEYDDPGLLVIYSGEFTDTLQFPQEVAFPLPEGARGIQATSRESDGRLMTQEWQIVDGKLVYTLPRPGFHIEYYLDRPPSGDQRQISYTFETPYAVDSLIVRVQNPARATDFSLTPLPDASIVDKDGLTYALVNRSSLKPGDKTDLSISYRKSDQGLTSAGSAAVQITPTAPAGDAQETVSESSFTSWLPYLLIGVGVVALAGVTLYWILRVRISATSEAAGIDTRSRKSTPPDIPTQERGEERAFCTKCGRQFGAEERFCAKCGAPRSRLG
jgi:hypothetical protein